MKKTYKAKTENNVASHIDNIVVTETTSVDSETELSLGNINAQIAALQVQIDDLKASKTAVQAIAEKVVLKSDN